MLCALDGGSLGMLMLCTYFRCQIYLFSVYCFLFVIFFNETSCKHRCYGAEVIYVTFLFIC